MVVWWCCDSVNGRAKSGLAGAYLLGRGGGTMEPVLGLEQQHAGSLSDASQHHHFQGGQ